MTYPFTRYLTAALLSVLLLSSCHRQTAYFQPSTAYRADQPTPVSVPLNSPVAPEKAPTEQLVQATVTLSQIDAYVRNDQPLATSERLANHLNRAKKLLASPHKTLESNATNVAGTSARNTMMERRMLKKINKQLDRQLAPNHPEKAMLAHRGN